MQQKQRLTLVLVLVAAFVAAAFLAGYFAQIAKERDTRELVSAVRSRHLPAIETARNLRETFSTLQKDLADASIVGGLEVLRDADSTRDRFMQLVDSEALRDAPQIQDIRAHFDAYYPHAREVAVRLVQDEKIEAIESDVTNMYEHHRGLDSALEELLEAETQRLEQSLSRLEQRPSARDAPATLVLGCSVMAVVLVMFGLAELWKAG